jgi:hypothetical protein
MVLSEAKIPSTRIHKSYIPAIYSRGKLPEYQFSFDAILSKEAPLQYGHTIQGCHSHPKLEIERTAMEGAKTAIVT